jgi:anti-sigma regulatory factor (Ser/Thr protein kinase)
MNVASYGYPEGTEGYLDVDIQKVAVSKGHPDNRVVIRFEDGGIPFNPLEQKDPDITLPWKQRPIGGLGVYLILRMMDDVRYAYVDNRNVLTVEKII